MHIGLDDCFKRRKWVKIAAFATCMRIRPNLTSLHSMARVGAAIGLIIAVAGCDPVINIGGANFPGWLLCAIVGTVAAALMRQLFVAAGIEPYVGPAILINRCLALLLGCYKSG